MVLTRVTLTGADDTVDPAELVRLSRIFPFVEWGLLTGSRFRARFPSLGWLENLKKSIADSDHPVQLSLHICGSLLREIMQGAYGYPWPLQELKFDRCQLNFHGDAVSGESSDNIIDCMRMPQWPARETIIQLDGVNDWILERCVMAGLCVSGLYDCSHGAGIKPDGWPKPNPRWEIGYAGGLGPETINSDLDAIAKSAGQQRFWIDMETKLRDVSNRQDVFCLARCQSVLEDVHRIISQ